MRNRKAIRFWFGVTLVLTCLTAFCNAVFLMIWTDHPGKEMSNFARSYFLFFTLMTVLLMIPTFFLWRKFWKTSR